MKQSMTSYINATIEWMYELRNEIETKRQTLERNDAFNASLEKIFSNVFWTSHTASDALHALKSVLEIYEEELDQPF